MNAGELILDADADTSITADTDDQIDIKAGGSDVVTITGSGLGIGVTPESDWENAVDVLQISVGAAIHSYNNDFDNGPYITQNARDVQSGPWKRIGAGYATSMGNYNGVITFQVAGSGSADDEITWTTGLEVLNDGKTRAKNGLLFGTDTAAANALDDYEEGTWTAVVRVGGSGGTDNGDSTGHYVKIGATVWIRAVVPVDSTVVGTGTIFMTGLPFTSEAGSASAISFTVNDRIDTTDIKARVDAGSTNIAFSLVPATTSNTAAGAPHTIIGSGAGKYFYVGGVYSVGS
jgi:hypothetical protein